MGGRVLGDITYPRHKSIEVYNPSTNSWTFVADLNVARYGVACGSLNNKLVAIGKLVYLWHFFFLLINNIRVFYDNVVVYYLGGADTPTVEIYDEVLNKWNFLADCPTNRENSTLIQVPISLVDCEISLN